MPSILVLKHFFHRKGFDNFNDFNWSVESGHFVEKTFNPDEIKGFVHVEKKKWFLGYCYGYH